MAFVVIQHLIPSQPSFLCEILSRTTAMPVLEARDGMVVVPNQVYVIPPNTRIFLHKASFNLLPRKKNDGHYPIDEFFVSLAAERQELAIGVIFSGTGSDGAKGIKAIAEAGGYTFAQDMVSAKFNSMPSAAIAEGVDFVLAPQNLAKTLNSYARAWRKGGTRLTPRGEVKDYLQAQLNKIYALIWKECGLDFSPYKPATLLRRINKRMMTHHLTTLKDYLEHLSADPEERKTLGEEFLIRVSRFFRDPECFDQVKDKVFSPLIAMSDPQLPLRVWVPGCASGEEAYSLAICFFECRETVASSKKVEIFASDCSEIALNQARRGYYPSSIRTQVAGERLKRYFVPEGSGYRIAQEIRECCIVTKHNLLRDPPFSKIDLISCRNVLIYLLPAVQKKLLALFHFALKPGGLLLLGNAETVGSPQQLFELLSKEHRLYSRKNLAKEPIASTYVLDRSPLENLSPSSLANCKQTIALPNSLHKAGEQEIEVSTMLEDQGTPSLILKTKKELVKELQKTKEYLKAIIAREQAANEELKSSSEEILSANEELQSTNEELSIAKNETQAANEELLTLNVELQQRSNDLMRINDDFNNILESIQLPLIMVNNKQEIKEISPAAKNLFGLKPSDIGRSLEELRETFRIDRLHQLTVEVIASLNTMDQEVQDRNGRWYSLRIKPYRTRNNRIDGAMIILLDIDTMRKTFKSLQEETLAKKDVAESASIAKSAFLANISHEVRTPLGAILSYAEQLVDPQHSKEMIVHCAKKIRKNVEHLTEIVDEILDIAKIEAGKFEVELHHFHLLPELAEAFSSLQRRAEEKALSFTFNEHGDIPQTIFSNAKSLRQIISNVVGNAIKFTTQGGVHITVSLQAILAYAHGAVLSIVVTDSGCGLDYQQQERIFTPFTQADSSVTRKFGGTGLGLSLARNLAELLGGTVRLLESQSGRGSTFEITINTGPLLGVMMLKNIKFADLQLQDEPLAKHFEPNQRLIGYFILLVEDVPDIQEIMSYFLTASGARVETAANGAEALLRAETHQFDLILMDIQMPVLDGYEASRRLRERGYTMPIIALTAYAMEGERKRCIAAGCVDYISKPVRPQTLIDLIERWVEIKSEFPVATVGRSLLADDAVIGPMVSKFVGNLTKQHKNLLQAHQEQNFNKLAKIAHQISGSAAAYGFPDLGKVASFIETQVLQNANNEQLDKLLMRFNELYTAVAQAHPQTKQ
jgi:two-component system CheB/CheR fusion protein